MKSAAARTMCTLFLCMAGMNADAAPCGFMIGYEQHAFTPVGYRERFGPGDYHYSVSVGFDVAPCAASDWDTQNGEPNVRISTRPTNSIVWKFHSWTFVPPPPAAREFRVHSAERDHRSVRADQIFIRSRHKDRWNIDRTVRCYDGERGRDYCTARVIAR